MKLKPLLHQWWVWLLAGTIVLLFLVALLTSTYFTPWLHKKIESSVQEQFGGLYTLRLYGLDTSLLRGRLEADSLTLEPDFAVWESLHEQQDSGHVAPSMLLDISMQQLVLSGLSYLGIARGKTMDLGTLTIQRPVVVVTQMREDTSSSEAPLHASLEGMAKGLRIRNISVDDATLQVKESMDAAAIALTLEGFTFWVDDLRLDSSSFEDKDRAYYAKTMAIEAGKAKVLLPDKTYLVEAGALKANTTDGTLNIGNLKFTPLLKHADYARQEGMAVTTLDVEVPEINASGINYGLLSRQNNVAANLIVVKQPSLSAYMDRKNFPQKGDKPLPHDLVQQLQTGLTIDKIEVKDMYVRYEELAPEATETGYITIESINLSISNITNDKNRMSADNPAVVELQASFNGKAPVAAIARMNLLNPDGHHTLQGTLAEANPATLNSIMEATAFVSIKEGMLQQGEFQVELTRTQATGSLHLHYNNFKVDVLTKDEDKRQSLGKKVISKVANKAVIKSDNPDIGGELRVGEIKVMRAQSKSFLAYWKDCLISGFMSTAGIASMGPDLEDAGR